MSFLPDDYKEPSGNYMKFQDKENNTFRALGSAVVGFEYWNNQNKPVRSKTGWQTLPEDIKIESNGKVSNITYFWAFPVWNYKENKIQILEINQKTVRGPINDLINNPKWGDPKEYDINVKKETVSGKTNYTVTPDPKTPLAPEIAQAYAQVSINLEALFTGGDPFAPVKADSTPAGVVSRAEAAKQMEGEVVDIAPIDGQA